MTIPRRDILRYAGPGCFTLLSGKAATTKPGMPGPFPGRVVGVEHPGVHCQRRLSGRARPQDDGKGHDVPHRRAQLDRRLALASSRRATLSASKSARSAARSSVPTRPCSTTSSTA